MKANEAPEKIYLRHNHKGDIGAGWLIFPLTNNDIEYTRTDAFIEKAEEFISTFFHPDDTELIKAVLNRFHEHMKLELK